MIQDTIKQRLRASLLVFASGKDAVETAAHLAADLREDGSWPDSRASVLDPVSASKQIHLARTMLLAKAQHLAPGEIAGTTRRALDWWLSRDFRFLDWHQDQIAVPRLVGEIALLCEDELSVGAWGKITEILTRSRWARWIDDKGWLEWSGAPVLGVAYNTILRGCLENSPVLCEGAFRRAFRNVSWSCSPDEGAPPVIHSAGQDCLPGDGTTLIRDYAHLLTLAYGTPWQAPTESTKAFVTYLLDFQQWLMWRDSPAGEASIAPSSNRLSAALAQLAQIGNPPRRVELAEMAERLGGSGGKALIGHRHFWKSRCTVHQRPHFYSSLELGNVFGLVGDNGDLEGKSVSVSPCFLRTGREYAGLGHDAGRPPSAGGYQPESAATVRAGSSGGVCEGEYGLAASEWHDNGLRAKRAWVFLDNSVVCLEAAVHGRATAEPCLTQINRCRLNGPVMVDGTEQSSRQPLEPDRRHDLTGVRRIEHAGFLYQFPTSTRVTVDLGATPDQRHPNPLDEGIFTLCIDHGKQPNGAASVCFVLPIDHVPASRIDVDTEIGQIEVLANHATAQAVRHRRLGIVCTVFWQPSVLALPDGGRLAVTSPCLVLCREHPDRTRSVSVANLLPRAAVLHLEYHGRCVCFELPSNTETGRSYRRQL